MSKLKYKVAALATGLVLLTSVSFAQNLEIYVKRNDTGIIMVCNQKALGKNYVGDNFYHYRKDNDHWILDKMTYLGEGRNRREFVREVTEKEIPTYTEGFYSLYYDQDQDEENLVTVWEDNIDSKVQDKWIELAKKHVKNLNSS